MLARVLRAAVAVAFALVALPTPGASFTLTLLAGSSFDTSSAVAADIAALAAAPADVELNVLPSIASDSLHRLRYERSVQLAIVPLPIVRELADAAARGDAEAIDVVRTLRLVMPLYVDELHFIVRADSTLSSVDEIGNARISLGERGSAVASTMSRLLPALFGEPPSSPIHLPPDEALVRLITDRSVDVVPVLGGQPVPLVANMKPEARRFVKLLRWNDQHPASDRLPSAFTFSPLRVRSYPNLLTEDALAIGVRTVLVANDHDSKPARDALARLARSLCRNLGVLHRNGHPKWREVRGTLPDIGAGIPYHDATSREINLCIAERVSGQLAPLPR